MYLFVENNIRGGISMISNRHAKANNKYLEDVGDFDPQKPNKFITYLDANNLYGFSMTYPLPTGEFKFLTAPEIENFDVHAVPLDGNLGYILEVDLEYPAELHDSHNDYPLAPQPMIIPSDMLSPYAQSFDFRGQSSVKLVPNLHDKVKYVLHLRNLKLYIELGMRLKKIHRILRFKQSPWLKPYVDLCTSKRQLAKTEFEKDLYKLLVNSVYGKTMENVRNRLNVQLVACPKKLKKIVAKPTFESLSIINEDLVMVRRMKEQVQLNKPIYTGFSILDISKTVMYDFHYKHIVSRYGHKAKLLFTDTDSLCNCSKTFGLYDDMKTDRDAYDTSNFDTKHDLHSTTNMKVLGKFKSETGSRAPTEFVGLRPKMYSLLISKQDKAKMTAKGVKRGYVKKHVQHDQFLRTLISKVPTRASFQLFRSTNHVVRTIEVDKLCLSAYDDKRYLLEDGCHSLAYGHYRIPNRCA